MTATRPNYLLPPPVRWNCDSFHDACDAGLFEGRNVILVDGEILEMPAPNPPHNTGVELVCEALRAIFHSGYWVRAQMALDLSLNIDPVPDVVVIVGSPRTVTTQPTSALLVVEISDSSFATDIGPKSHLYAEGGQPEYWVLDLNRRQLHVFRDPIVDPSVPRGHRYATVSIFGSTDSVSSLAQPSATVRVADLLP